MSVVEVQPRNLYDLPFRAEGVEVLLLGRGGPVLSVWARGQLDRHEALTVLATLAAHFTGNLEGDDATADQEDVPVPPPDTGGPYRWRLAYRRLAAPSDRGLPPRPQYRPGGAGGGTPRPVRAGVEP